MSVSPQAVKLTKWEEWRGMVIFLLLLIGSSIAAWHIPRLQPIVPIVLLSIGLFFDGISIAARISTAITGRHSSGFFLVGFAFYTWAWLSYPNTVLLPEWHDMIGLWLRKGVDLACLGVFHIMCHTTFGKENRNGRAEQSAPRVSGTRGTSAADAPDAPGFPNGEP